MGFVLSGRHLPYELAQQQEIGSPFFNIFGYTTELGPLEELDARELISSLSRELSEQDIEWVLERSQHWPILLQVLCREYHYAQEYNDLKGWKAKGEKQIAPFIKYLF